MGNPLANAAKSPLRRAALRRIRPYSGHARAKAPASKPTDAVIDLAA